MEGFGYRLVSARMHNVTVMGTPMRECVTHNLNA